MRKMIGAIWIGAAVAAGLAIGAGCSKKEEPPVRHTSQETSVQRTPAPGPTATGAGQQAAPHEANQVQPSVEKSAQPAQQTVVQVAADQTICPVMKSPIDKEIFVEYKGKKVYFCCADCKAVFEKDPEKYVKDLPQFRP